MRRVRATPGMGAIAISAAVLIFSINVRAMKTPAPHVLLQRMIRANQETAYRGDWVTELDSLQIWQKIYQDGRGHRRIEFVLPRALVGQEVLEIPPYLYIREKEGGKFYRRESSFDPQFLMRRFSVVEWNRIQQNYKVTVIPGQKIRQWPALELHFKPLIPDRPQIDVWVDARNGMLLGLQKSRANGKIFQRAYFQNLLLNPVLDPAQFLLLSEQMDTTRFRKPVVFGNLNLLQKQIPFALALPAWLPVGFQFQKARLLFFRGRKIVHLIYSDGLSSISLFESRNHPREAPKNAIIRRTGGIWEGRATTGNVGVILMGELQPSTLGKILAALPAVSSESKKIGRHLMLWLGILIVALILMTQFLTGKRRL